MVRNKGKSRDGANSNPGKNQPKKTAKSSISKHVHTQDIQQKQADVGIPASDSRTIDTSSNMSIDSTLTTSADDIVSENYVASSSIIDSAQSVEPEEETVTDDWYNIPIDPSDGKEKSSEPRKSRQNEGDKGSLYKSRQVSEKNRMQSKESNDIRNYFPEEHSKRGDRATTDTSNNWRSKDKNCPGSSSTRKQRDTSRSDSTQNRAEYDDNFEEKYDQFKAKYMGPKSTMSIMEFKIVEEKQGDLFAAPAEYSLGHCVAEDMNMGSGIAVQFRQEFKNVPELLDQGKTQGQVAILEVGGRYIYYLITKRVSSGKPTYRTLWLSLCKMRSHIVAHNVKKLALPRIGCGLDSLEWKSVKNMLEYIFSDVDINIVIYNFQQDVNAAPPPQKRKCRIVNHPKELAKIESGTIVVYFGSEDGHETDEMKSLCCKYPYLRNKYKTSPKTLGSYIQTHQESDGYNFYGCIVRKSSREPFSYTSFQKCLSVIQSKNRKDQYEYIAFQAFLEKGSELIVSKIVNLMRHAMTNVDVYVCWPDELRSYVPRV